MRDLTCKGMASKVVEEINSMDSIGFYLRNPVLLLQLKQVEFLKLVASGDHTAALKVAFAHLGPLAAYLALLKPLKETLVTLIQPSVHVPTEAASFPVLADSLQIVISRRLGI